MSSTSSKFTISQAIDSLGVNKFTLGAFFLIGIAMMFDGYDVQIIAYTNTQIAAEWGLDAVAKGSLASWSLVGVVCGSFIGGWLSDKFGRKKTMFFGIFLYGLLTVPCALAPNYLVFAVFRVCAGLFLGVCTPIVTTLFTEFTPTKQRSFFITFGMAWMIAGWVMAAIVGSVIVQMTSWRWCYAIGSIPAIYAFVFLKLMPESPHWFAAKGKTEDAAKVLAVIKRRAKKDIGFELVASNIILPPVATKGNPGEVWKKKYLRITIALIVLYWCGNFTIYGVNTWLPSLMLARGYEITSAYMLAMAQNAAAVIANCTTGFFAEVLGRKRNVIMGYLLAIAACLLAGFASGSFAVVLGSLIFLGFAINYAITCVQPIMSESYPAEIRNSGVGTIVALGRTAGIIAPTLLGVFVGLGFSFSTLFCLLAIPMGIGFLTALTLPAGAKGKSLDDVANENA